MIECASILLAAGNSSRLGRPKQLLKLGSETLLHRTARLACDAGCFPNIVVLGAYADDMQAELLGLNAEPIVNTNWQQGMGSSVAAGVTFLLRKSKVARALLLVCDQPALDAELLLSLINQATSSGKAIVACRYAGALGVPAVFTSSLFPELAALAGEQGARRLFARYPKDTAVVDFPGGKFDIDTIADTQHIFGLDSF